MFNNLKFIFIILATIILYSCSHPSKSNDSNSNFEVIVDNNELFLNGDTTKNCLLSVSINQELKYEKALKGGQTISILELYSE